MRPFTSASWSAAPRSFAPTDTLMLTRIGTGTRAAVPHRTYATTASERLVHVAYRTYACRRGNRSRARPAGIERRGGLVMPDSRRTSRSPRSPAVRGLDEVALGWHGDRQ